jgi:hypothetical protein
LDTIDVLELVDEQGAHATLQSASHRRIVTNEIPRPGDDAVEIHKPALLQPPFDTHPRLLGEGKNGPLALGLLVDLREEVSEVVALVEQQCD